MKKKNKEEVAEEKSEIVDQEVEENVEQDAANAESETKENTAEEEQKEDAPVDEKEALELKVSELNDKYLRLYSEFDNYRRRTIKEKSELVKTASESVMLSLLPLLDDLDRASQSNEKTEDVAVVKEGFELVNSKFQRILEQKGLKEMECIKKEFDAELHEAITQIPAESKKMRGKIVDVIEKGYYLNEKVIRHAKVVVGS